MGIIKAFFNAMGGNLADQWQEVLEADDMSDTTVFTKGVKVRKNDRRNNNKKGTDDVISNGSIIHVYPGQFMILVEGGKIIDFTAEEGYYKVDNSAAPSLFAGQFGKSIVDAFSRIKFGGVPSYAQKAYFINLQEIKGIRFGTRTPVNYFDSFYNSELFLRAHGNYSIKITDPIKFYTEAIPKNSERVDIADINEQYLSEFLEALTAAINRMSADGIRISYVASKSRELSQYMANELDEAWKNMRGIEVQSVGIASVSYDDESKELINMRNKGAMLGDAAVREGYVQGSIARGIEAAGSNSAGSAQGFFGVGMGMMGAGNFMGAATETNRRQMESDNAKREASASGWLCSCGAKNEGKFCSECGAKKPVASGSWVCSCGKENSGKFCSECGSPKPEGDWFCTECGAKNSAGAKFCSECGNKR
ncbi:MAG: zinc-ribbon domain-containing protein [Ruminococcaceae bacterium]|nr:zinc-ribbon domain-containing protein [Oscillospiraceae bacterium]